ncbi:MAG: Rrf2 family transcriptional regulator [Halobacteriaceae archaeon]
MSSIELTASQRRILTALLDLHADESDAVKGEAIADAVDRNPGTIRNQMQSLKALQLVEGVPGPKGGYKPLAAAYEALEIQEIEGAADVPLRRNGAAVEDTNVEEIDLTSVHHPELCRAEIHVRGPVRDFETDDTVRVGPTPLSDLVIEGSVEGTDETESIVILRIESMQAPGERAG